MFTYLLVFVIGKEQNINEGGNNIISNTCRKKKGKQAKEMLYSEILKTSQWKDHISCLLFALFRGGDGIRLGVYAHVHRGQRPACLTEPELKSFRDYVFTSLCWLSQAHRESNLRSPCLHSRHQLSHLWSSPPHYCLGLHSNTYNQVTFFSPLMVTATWSKI